MQIDAVAQNGVIRMTNDLKPLLAHHPVFSKLGAEGLQTAVEIALSRHYGAGAFITYGGDVWPYLMIVASGCLEVIKGSEDGKQLVALTLDRGEAFWGLAFFSDGVRTPVSVRAREDSDAFMWRRDQMVPLLLSDPEAMWTLCQLMINRMNQASQIVENFAFKPMAKRLAGFLAEMFAESGETSLKRTLTLDDIAARVGSSREEVCRALYQFSNQNLIEITRTEFSLMDKAGLLRLADQEPTPS